MSAEPTTVTTGEHSNLRRALFVFLIFAALVAGYLSYLKIASADAVCIESGPFDCGLVLNSVYSEISGVPIAYLGFIVDIILIGFLLVERRWLDEQIAVILYFGLALFAFLFSVYLVYLQAAVIQAFCPWCLTHEALVTLYFIGGSVRLWRVLQAG